MTNFEDTCVGDSSVTHAIDVYTTGATPPAHSGYVARARARARRYRCELMGDLIFLKARRRELDVPAAHAVAARGCLLAYQSSRVDAVPHREWLRVAEHHSREALDRDRTRGDVWWTRALVTHCCGESSEARAAADTAVMQQGDDWRAHICDAVVNWGDHRMCAAERALRRRPDVAFARWLSATVLVARGATSAALDELDAACLRHNEADPFRLPISGVHYLRGLVLASMGRDGAAMDQFRTELSLQRRPDHPLRELAANSWCAIGALHLRQGSLRAARQAFSRALGSAWHHPRAEVGFVAAGGNRWTLSRRVERLRRARPGELSRIDEVMGAAAALAVVGRHQDAADICQAAISSSPATSAGWHIPVDPLLRPYAHPDAWRGTLDCLATRASCA